MAPAGPALHDAIRSVTDADVVHRRGETDDHCYVSVPGRRAVACADFYQGFLPNVGNGKLVQRYVEDWALAMREMAALELLHLLPAHGDALSDPDQIQEAQRRATSTGSAPISTRTSRRRV